MAKKPVKNIKPTPAAKTTIKGKTNGVAATPKNGKGKSKKVPRPVERIDY